jgi:pantothenate kinase
MPAVDFDALADRCLELLKQSQEGNHDASCAECFNDYKQVFVGIAGTPGSGKSFIAEEVAKAIANRNPNGDANRPECIVIGMDGYHLPRKELKAMAEVGAKVETGDDEGNPIKVAMTYKELMGRRGASFTYNSAEFIQQLRHIKANGKGSLPVYDRDKHDPVPDRVRVERHHKIILVEGLYLLCLQDKHWKALGQLWDDSWYIDVSMKEIKRRLVERHLKYWNKEKTKIFGGDDEKAAARKAEANDMKNARCIQRNSKDMANLVVSNEKILEDDDKNADVEAAE